MYHIYKVVLLDKIAELIQVCHMAQVAMDKVYEVYGAGATVTNIINQMWWERQVKWWPPTIADLGWFSEVHY